MKNPSFTCISCVFCPIILLPIFHCTSIIHRVYTCTICTCIFFFCKYLLSLFFHNYVILFFYFSSFNLSSLYYLVPDCGPVPSISNGGVSVNGATAVYVCRYGYRLNSTTNTRQCLPNGTWTGGNISCTCK